MGLKNADLDPVAQNIIDWLVCRATSPESTSSGPCRWYGTGEEEDDDDA